MTADRAFLAEAKQRKFADRPDSVLVREAAELRHRTLRPGTATALPARAGRRSGAAPLIERCGGLRQYIRS